MRTNEERCRWVAALLLAAVWLDGPQAEAQEFNERPITGEINLPLVIDSQAQDGSILESWVFGWEDNYAPLLDVRTRIIANSWVREATLVGTNDPFDDWELARDECVETREARSDLPCTTPAPEDVDRLEYQWATDTMPRSTAFADQFNPDMGTGALGVPVVDEHSLLNPGTILRFVSGPPPPFDEAYAWMSLPHGPPRGEHTGFRVESIWLSPSSPPEQGTQDPLELKPHERVIGLLVGGYENEDSVYFTLPPTKNGQTMAVWGAVSHDFTANVWARCGAKPTRLDFDWMETFDRSGGVQTPAFLRLSEKSDGQTHCPDGWHVVVENPPAVPGPSPHVAFVVRWAENLPSREYSDVRVGIEFQTNGPDEDAWIRRAVREAAWRLYGAGGGIELIHSFTFDEPGACNNVTICWRNRPAGACPDGTGKAQPGTPTGSAHICWDTSAPGIASADESGAAALLAHELAHVFLLPEALVLGHGDEYWVSNHVAKICGLPDVDTAGVSVARCTHTLMTISRPTVTSLCTDLSHNLAVEHRFQTVNGEPTIRDGLVQGTSSPTECWNGEISYAGPFGPAAWDRVNNSGRAPYSHPLDRSADNYDFELFAWTAFGGPVLWDIGRILN